ncbi:MAG: hypothetical protein JWR26_2466 [Pedosphaera sp.]|nr:hypothetical protein [Pedosphaera sp.]
MGGSRCACEPAAPRGTKLKIWLCVPLFGGNGVNGLMAICHDARKGRNGRKPLTCPPPRLHSIRRDPFPETFLPVDMGPNGLRVFVAGRGSIGSRLRILIAKIENMSANGQRPTIPWKRFWCRFGGPIHVGEYSQGFLSDPDGEFSRLYNPELSTLEQLLTEPCLILCGDPGIGKSTMIQEAKVALQHSVGNDGHVVFLDFRRLPNESFFARRTFDSAEWKHWKTSTSKLVLVVDGVDEGLVKIPGFVSYLTAQLKDEPVERLKLILVCRSAEWPISEGRELISLWGRSEKQSIYELCPLRQCDAELAAEKWGLNKAAFIESVYQQTVVALAALPTTLFFLLEEFRESGGFRGTHRELYERGCQRLMLEVDPHKTEALRQRRNVARVSSPQELNESACRLAALLLICGKSSVHTGPLDEIDASSDLNIGDVADAYLTENVILDAIATGLFTSRGPQRFGFAHQTFAECLGAQFLARMPLVQIRSFLCERDAQQEYVVPQLAEMVAWLAGAREDFFDYLCQIEPEVLLRSDVSKIQNPRKSALVMAVLEKAKRAELFDERNIGRFYHTLKHPGLMAQLRPFIIDKSLHAVVRRMAMTIAAECKEADLTDILLGIVKDSTEQQHIRDQAAHALEELIPTPRLPELIPLALGQVGSDPEDTIRGCAIGRLVPVVWSVSKALSAVRAARDTHFYGSYWSLLKYHLPHHLTEADLPPVLARLIRWTHCFDSLSWFEEIADVAFAMALKNLGKRGIRKLAVRVWVVKQQHHHQLPHSKESQFIQLLEADKNLRREFVAAIINDPNTPSDDFHTINGFSCSLFLSSDLEWALNQIMQSPADRRSAWVNTISHASNPDSTPQCWDLLLQRIEEIPELKVRFEWLRAWNLDEPMARKAKARWLKDERWKKRHLRPPPALDIEGMLKTTFEQIASGGTARWIDLCNLLSLDKGQTRVSHSFQHDLTEFPGWKASDETRRAEIRAAARLFLLNHSDGFSQVGGRTNFFDPGFMAVWLLRNEVRSDVVLCAAVAAHWIEALLDQSNKGSNHYKEIAALAYELNPDTTLRFFSREIMEDDRQHGRIHCCAGFRTTWNDRFTTAALGLIRAGTLKDGSVESLLTFLGTIVPAETAACAKELLVANAVTDPAQQDRIAGIASCCIGAMPAAAWDFAWPLVESDQTLATKVLLRVSNRFDHDRKKFLPTLTEDQLAALYLKLHILFPPESDPPRNNGHSGVSARQSISWFRNDVINALEARGTEKACLELLRLASTLPTHAVWFRWRCYNARISKRRVAWSPPLPQTVLLLAKSGEGRLVKDANDLLEVVMESLGRLQSKLTQSSLPRAEVLWRYEGADTRQRNFKPHDEAFLSNEIARWLRDDLNQRGIIIGREVQARRGQRTDIWVEAVARNRGDASIQTVTVVIEVKGCWNAEVQTAVDSQLVGDYLRPNGLTHGIYIIGWFICAAWKNQKSKLVSQTLALAREEIAQLTSAYDGKNNLEQVRGVVLDCRYPA